MKDEAQEMSADKQRKMSRMEAVRKAEDTGSKVVGVSDHQYVLLQGGQYIGPVC